MKTYRSKKLKNIGSKLLFMLGVSPFLVFFLFPVFWMVLTSFKMNSIVMSLPPKFIFSPTLTNYMSVLQNSGFLSSFLDSMIIACSTTALTVFCSSTLSYALTRFNIMGSNTLSSSILIMRMVPAIVLMIPLYIIGMQMNLLDTYFIMIIAITTFALPFQIWFLLGFFAQIPRSIDESALIDGCSWFSAFFRVVLPLAAPGLTATTLLTFFFSYNDIFFGIVLTDNKVTIAPLNLLQFMGERSFDWGAVMAGSALLMIPTLLLGLIFQRFLVKGLTGGSVKG